MNRTRGVRQKCLECAGDSHKEVTFCCVVDCPLYPYRFGYSIKSKRYEVRMGLARQNYPDEFKYVMKLLADHIKMGCSSSSMARIDEIYKKLWACEGIGSQEECNENK